jgi:hypothetical protein
MGKKDNSPVSINKPKLLLVEGKDELNLFNELLEELDLINDIQVIEVGGKEKFATDLPALPLRSGFSVVSSIGIVRDADNDPEAAFRSILGILKNMHFPEPTAPLQTIAGSPSITIMIVPDIDSTGMIEDVCLASVAEDIAMDCVNQYFECLQAHQRILDENDIPKARVRAFLASREWLEIAHFEYIQKCMESYEPLAPESAAVSVPKVHAFLASRYTPDLDLGIAARKSEREDRYWQFDHSAFDKIKEFLQML